MLAAGKVAFSAVDVLAALLVAVAVIVAARAAGVSWLVELAIVFGVALLVFALLVSG